MAPRPGQDPRHVRTFNRQEFQEVLKLLDAELGRSELIRAVAPLRLVAIGGFLAVTLFGNRESTVDIDSLIDPNVTAVDEYHQKIKEAIRKVARDNSLPSDWLNDELSIFISRKDRERYFLESIEQQLILYDGVHLQVYAGNLLFALERKFRRVDHPGGRRVEIDLSDAIAILEYLTRDRRPYSIEFCQSLDANGIQYPISVHTIQKVARRFAEVYGRHGIG